MALIRCPECGKEISDKSKQCVHCGFPLDQLPVRKNDNNLISLITFVRRSCVAGIVLLGIMLEVVYPAMIVTFSFLYVWPVVIFLAAVYVIFSIIAPFSIVKTVKTNVKTNYYAGKSIKYNSTLNSFVFDNSSLPNPIVVPCKDILSFDGPNTLKVTYLYNGQKQVTCFGYTTRADVIKLREFCRKHK